MNTFSQQVFANQQASLDNFIAVQNSLLSGFEKLVDLNLKVMKASFDEISEKSREAAKLQDAQEAFTFSTALLQPNTEKAMAYGKHVYDICSGLQVDVTKLTEAQFAQFQQQVSEAIDQLSKNAPAGSESAVALLKSSLASASNAYENVTRSARQAADMAEKNIAAATDATIKATSEASKAGAKAASKA
ncbi:MAG TPA: phasin family protein [Burkholderiaceae bacterium]|nr:phasin family protein [Burkholderiaceae bacterium]